MSAALQHRRKLTGATAQFVQRAHRPDYLILLFVGLLMLLGLIVMYAIGPQRAQVLNSINQTDFYSGMYFVIKQTASLVLAVVALAVMTFMPLRIIKQYAAKILIAGLAACAMLFVFGNLFHIEQIVYCSLGACRWFELGPLGSFQPAELLKFGILIFIARFLADKIRSGTLNNWQETIMPLLILVGVAMLFVIVVQKDMGTGIALLSIVTTMLMVAGINRKYGLRLLAGLLAVGVLLIIVAPHRVARVMTFMQGDSSSSSAANTSGAEYHIHHAKIAIGSGGVFGVGIGNSVQATGYLPEAINDSVFAILGETFGFLGLMILLILFGALLMRILRVSDRLADSWMQLVAAGVFGWLLAHVVLNVASMTGVFPLTGITLPFLSFGGTSMIFIAAAIGLVFQLSRYTSHAPLNKKGAYANFERGRGIGRARHAGRRRPA